MPSGKKNRKSIIIWGGTGNFKVLRELLSDDYQIIGFFDRNKDIEAPFPDIPYLGDIDDFDKWILTVRNPGKISFLISIGPEHGKDRILLQNYLAGKGLSKMIAVHRTAFVAGDAILGAGTQVYAGARICTGVVIGEACIINTGAIVDHECKIDNGVTVGPGAALAGLVNVGKFADIYTGAVILPRINIGENAVVGAGAVVLKDVEPDTVVVGNPARFLKSRK